MRPFAIARIAVPLIFLSSVASAELVVVGDEFQVNSYTIGQQFVGSVARGAAGGFVVTWTGLAQQDGSDNGIFGQRFSSAAVRIGGEFQINTYTQDSQGGPSIDSDAQGGFVVVWDSYYQDGSSYQGAFGQRFASNGQRVGTEFQVNTYTLGSQYDPAVAVTPSGNFVVAWESYDDPAGQDGSYGGIFAQRFDSGGARVGTEFMVNTYTENVAFSVDAVDSTDGSVLFVWADSQAFELRIRARLFDSAGQPTGPQFTVGEPTTHTQRDPTVDVLVGGGFIVAWNDDPGGFTENIVARRLDASATPVGAQFLVNTYTVGRQIAPNVVATFDGGFAIAWQSPGNDGSAEAALVRLYDSAGLPKGDPTRMNVTTADTQGSPNLVETSPRNMVGVWSSRGQDGSFEGIFGIRLTPFGVPIGAKKLLIKTPAAGPSKNKLVFLSKDTGVEAPAGIAGDPRCAPLGSGTPTAGGTLRVVGLGGDFTLNLPCIGWTANSSGTKYSYRDATGTTCKTVKLQDGSQLKAVCKGPQVAYALGAAQGDVTVAITLGETLQYCATFGASTSADVKRDGSDGRTYKALDASAPLSCP